MIELERRRKEKGITREELAEKVGITREAIGYYERGEREPKASILKRIAKILDCRMEDLI